jgi:hypothetical protein
MNCLCITLFSNIVAGIVQKFIESWNQLLYPRVIEVCRQPFEPRPVFLLHLIVVISPSFGEFTPPLRHILPIHNFTINSNNLFVNFRWAFTLRWEIVWRNAPCIWQDFGSALTIKTRLTQTKPVLPPSNEHGSQVKDQGWRQCCHNKHKKFPYRPTHDVSLLSGHVSYKEICMNKTRNKMKG